MVNFRLGTRLFCFAILILSCEAFAFKFSPLSSTVNLSSGETRTIFTLENEGEQPVAVELSLAHRKAGRDGQETHQAVDSNILRVYPEQLIIPPREKRSIRVSWHGETPAQELPFRLIAEQLPINMPGESSGGTGIRMLMRYIAALYINPGNTTAEVHPEGVRLEGDDVVVTLVNKGTRHQILNKLEMTFVHEGHEITLKDDQLKGLIGENLLPNQPRDFSLGAIRGLTRDHQLRLKVLP